VYTLQCAFIFVREGEFWCRRHSSSKLMFFDS